MKNLVEYIERMIIGTNEGKIIWTKLNDNSFVWKTSDSKDNKINVIVQNMISFDNKKIGEVLFRIFDVESRNVILDVRTEKTSEENKKKIIDLFLLIKDNSGFEKLDILDDLLKKI